MTKKQDNRVKNNLIRYSCDNVFRYKVGSNKRKCNNRILIREDTIEKYLLENLKVELENIKMKNKIKKETPKVDNAKQIKKIENKILKLKDLYLDDLIDKNTYTKDYEKYKEELQKLKSNVVLEIEKDFSTIERIINSDYITIYNKLTLENKRKFWLSVIDKIYILDGNIKEVTFL